MNFTKFQEKNLNDSDKIWMNGRSEPVTESEKTLPNEIAYADDVDFIARERLEVTQIQRVLKRYNLEVNVDKTEKYNTGQKWKQLEQH